MGYFKDDKWIVEPRDTVFILRRGLVGFEIENEYRIVDSSEIEEGNDRKRTTLGDLLPYVGRTVQVEDWTRRHSTFLTGYIGTLELHQQGVVVKGLNNQPVEEESKQPI